MNSPEVRLKQVTKSINSMILFPLVRFFTLPLMRNLAKRNLYTINFPHRRQLTGFGRILASCFSICSLSLAACLIMVTSSSFSSYICTFWWQKSQSNDINDSQMGPANLFTLVSRWQHFDPFQARYLLMTVHCNLSLRYKFFLSVSS